MAFDLATARPVQPGGFDLSTAKPIDDPQDTTTQQYPLEDRVSALEFISGLAKKAGKDPAEFIKYIGPAAANMLIGSQGINFSLPQMEMAATMASGAAAAVPAGLAGLVQSINPYAPEGAGADTVRRVQDNLTYKPQTPLGQFGMELAGETIETGRDALGRVGEAVGGPAGRTIAENAPDVLGTILGGAGALGKARAASALTPAEIQSRIPRGQGLTVAENAPSIGIPPAPVAPNASMQRELAVLRGEGDTAAAGYKIGQGDRWADGGGPGKIVKDPLQDAVIKQGAEPGTVAMVQASPQQAKKNMLQMLNIIKRGRENKLFAVDNRPLDVVGDSLVNRIQVVKTANQIAAKKLKGEATKLQGQYPDWTPALTRLKELFDDHGVGTDVVDGRLALDFSRSDFRGMTGVQKKITKVMDELQANGQMDAYDGHTFKRFVDTMVSYGKSNSSKGIPAQAERILKGLRNAIDGVLDDNYPDYKYVNDVYSETIGGLDMLQDAMGKRIDLTGKYASQALGQESRKLLSNYRSRSTQQLAVDELDRLAMKYSDSAGPGSEIVPVGALGRISGVALKDLNDSMKSQIQFASDLESRFKSHAGNSLQGVMDKSADKMVEGMEAANAAQGGMNSAALAGARYVAKKLKGQNDDKYLQAWIDLLNGN